MTNWGDGPMWYLAEGNLALILACTREMPRLRRHMLEQPTWLYNYASPFPTLRRKTSASWDSARSGGCCSG